MLAVIDESGDPGFKAGSSSHFIIGMVIFDRFSDAEAAARMIAKLRDTVGYKREFHFNKCDNRKRDQFFEAIKPAKFKVRILAVEKRQIHSPYLKNNKEGFVNYCLKMMMKYDNERLQDTHVKIDGSGSRIFKRASRNYLTRELREGCVRKLTYHDSDKDLLIQLADMVVSAYSRPYHNPDKENAFRWRNLIESKIENVWNFQ